MPPPANATYIQKSSVSWLGGFAAASANAGDPVTLQFAGGLAGFVGLTTETAQYIGLTDGTIESGDPASNR